MLRANIIHRCRDEWGVLNILEAAGKRYLSFGNEIEQSCIDMCRPARLCYSYTQAMMLGCLFEPTPRHIMVLGLGAGSLVQAVLAGLPDSQITAVEQRSRVVELAREWFDLPQDKRLKVAVCDAYDYLNKARQPVDLIFADLYLDAGMDDLQAQQGFLTACRMALKPGGLLVINYWLGNPLTSMAMNQTLEAAFEHPPISMNTVEGNCLAFAFDGRPPRLDNNLFLKQAERLGEALDIPLQRHARTLLHQNRWIFRIGSRVQLSSSDQ
ncbi:MAG: methyltransferase domain-containing protein [Chromatiales bacterium]|jgi:spermidine synthase